MIIEKVAGLREQIFFRMIEVLMISGKDLILIYDPN